MKHSKLMIYFGLSILVFGTTRVHGQELTLSSGSEAVGLGGNVSYSIGQVGYTTQSGSTGTVEVGVQQSYSILTSSGFEITNIQLELTAYPNPTINSITLKVEDYQQEKLTLQLFDVQGKLLDTKKIVTNKTEIPMEHLPSSTYFLRVEEENQLIKSFSIIKK